MSSVRNFGIAFVVALLIFSIAAYFAVGYVGKLFASDAGNAGSSAADSRKFDDGEKNNETEIIKSGRSFNLVIIGTDYDPQSYTDYTEPAFDDGKLHVIRRVNATAILFVRFDKENRALRVASIPAETAVTVDYVPMTLGQAYGYKGGAFVKDRVASLVGTSVDFLFEFSGREFAAFAKNNLMTHDFTVPINVTTSTEKRIPSMTFTKGQVVKTETALFTLLHHTAYNYRTAEVANRHILLADIFLQTLSKLTVTSDPVKYYNTISALHPDMTKEDVTELMEVLYTIPTYIGSSESPTTVSIIEFYKFGTREDATGVFRVNTAAAKAAFIFDKDKTDSAASKNGAA